MKELTDLFSDLEQACGKCRIEAEQMDDRSQTSHYKTAEALITIADHANRLSRLCVEVLNAVTKVANEKKRQGKGYDQNA